MVENIDAVENNCDGNDDGSIFSSFSESLNSDGDDDLSIAQMCQLLHLADDKSESFEFV